MQIKTCQAENLAALMERMKASFGSQAVLLSVRRVESTVNSAGSKRQVIEGTIAIEGDPLPAPLAPAVPVAAVKMAEARPATRPATTEEQPLPELPTVSRGLPQLSEKKAKVHAVALLGPMGAGKTTTAAKIAGRLAQMRSEPVGLISTDTERPGGSALLAAYAEELQLCMTTAAAASDLHNRLARWACRGPLVIDTRGYNPRDSLAIERLGALLDATEMKMERYLVLSATEHPAVARECLQAFSAVQLTGVVLTRVDQAAGIGHCLAEVRKSGIEIPFIGTGEVVPDDLREPSASSLAALETSSRNVLA